MKRRQVFLTMALVATVIAVWKAPESDAGVVAPTKEISAPKAAKDLPEAGASRPASAMASIGTLNLRAPDDGAPPDPFETTSEPAAPKAAVAAPMPVALPAAAPVAPPLPFRYLGRYEQDGTAAVFLQYNDQSLVAREGDVLVDNYKVQSLRAGELVLLYLPLNQAQTLKLETTN